MFSFIFFYFATDLFENWIYVKHNLKFFVIISWNFYIFKAIQEFRLVCTKFWFDISPCFWKFRIPLQWFYNSFCLTSFSFKSALIISPFHEYAQTNNKLQQFWEKCETLVSRNFGNTFFLMIKLKCWRWNNSKLAIQRAYVWLK